VPGNRPPSVFSSAPAGPGSRREPPPGVQPPGQHHHPLPAGTSSASIAVPVASHSRHLGLIQRASRDPGALARPYLASATPGRRAPWLARSPAAARRPQHDAGLCRLGCLRLDAVKAPGEQLHGTQDPVGALLQRPADLGMTGLGVGDRGPRVPHQHPQLALHQPRRLAPLRQLTPAIPPQRSDLIRLPHHHPSRPHTAIARRQGQCAGQRPGRCPATGAPGPGTVITGQMAPTAV
jgi:hypothetical protein